MHESFTLEPRIAYFSMEIALRSEIPTYAGGLGVLAGDTVRAAADLEVPVVAVTLVSRAGYFHQQLETDGNQREDGAPWQPADFARLLEAKVAVAIDGRDVWIAAWLYVLKGHMGGEQPVILLDTDLPENHEEDRQLTHYLYGGDQTYRFKQEVVLGIGGARLLQALGFQIRKYHMNEGHSALLGLELLRRLSIPAYALRPGEPTTDVARVRELCIFTTHTPVEAGHDRFGYALVERVLGGFIDIALIKRLAGVDELNMTRLALNLSEYVNGVAKKHAEVSRRLFPGYSVHAVTNGVHPFTWTAAPFRTLYDQYLPGWCHEPELLARVDCCVPDEAVWGAHLSARTTLIKEVEERTGIRLSPDVPIIGFARRMTAYKRPELLFSDIQRLRQIAGRFPFQIVMAGKAHPHDAEGKRLIMSLYEHQRALADVIPMAYLPNYAMDVAQLMVAGVDLWLNTPLAPMEASGTSGMKAAFNGVPQISILDGWWLEGCIENITGWSIGADGDSQGADDARSLYDKLEQVVLPRYAADRGGWIATMKGAISKNAAFFHSHRMMRRYATEAYLR